MSHRFPVPWRALWVVPLVALALLALFVGSDTHSQAQAANASTAQSTTYQVIDGPPAEKHVVDLHNLPAAPPNAGQHVTLPFRLPHGPNAFPAAPGAGKVPPSVLDPSAVAASVLSVTNGFLGISASESNCGCEPPDGDMAVGPNHIIVGVNVSFRVYNKTGTPLSPVINYDQFFAQCGPSGLGSSDPIAVYDPVADRFTVGILRYSGNGYTSADSYVSLAVSQSGDPTRFWNLYCFNQPYGPLSQGVLYDFPHIGVGPDALYTTGNVYAPPNAATNVSARVNAYDKAAMYAGASNASQKYVDVMLNSDNSPADTIRPALFNVGLPAGPTYFMNVGTSQVPGGAPSYRVTVWKWAAPFSGGNLTMLGGPDLSPYTQAVPMVQPPPGNPVPAEGFIDVRLLGAAYANGTLWGAHTIGCSQNGTATDCVQWFQVGNLNTTPNLVQQGIVSGAANESRAYPNVAVDAAGNVRLTYAYSSNSDYVGIRHTGRTPSDPLGTMQAESLVKAGEQSEVGVIRWGDYSGAVTDPDGVRLWHFEEFSQNNQDWGTWVSAARFVAAATSTPTVTGTPPTATATSVPPSATRTGTATRTSTPAPTSTMCPIQFNDVPSSGNGSTFYSYIRCLACRGIVSGYQCGGPGEPCPGAYYRPGENVTRGQLSKIISNSAGFSDPVPSNQQSFADVAPGSTFWVYIERLSSRGAISGYPCGGPGESCDSQHHPYFRPGSYATRGQIAKIDAIAAGFKEPVERDAQDYNDVPNSSPFWQYIQRLTDRGIVSGYSCGAPGEPCPGNYFRPQANTTRGQMAKIAANTFYPNCQTPSRP